jgi:hypothetical protein
MLSDRVVPERTIDSLLAAEWTRKYPHSLIWSPTNYQNSPDHILPAQNLSGFVLECKAVVGRGATGEWSAPVRRPQLDSYCRLTADVLYLFVTRPDDEQAPWTRTCRECGGTCRRCPRDARSISELEPLVATAPIELRFQPWFSHWAVVVTAQNLRNLLGKRNNLALDKDLASAAEVTRLCHFFSMIDSGIQSPQLLSDFGLDNFRAQWSQNIDQGATPPVFAIQRPVRGV